MNTSSPDLKSARGLAHSKTWNPRIPTGFRPQAQGWRTAPALRTPRATTPLAIGVEIVFAPISQGSSCLATLGFIAESRWDSAAKKSAEPRKRPSLAAGGFDKKIRVWDLGSGQLIQIMHGHSAGLRSGMREKVTPWSASDGRTPETNDKFL